MRRSEIRDHLLDTALRLFNQHGYHATGVDLIIAEARVAKTTLYRHFATKEELILAALERRDEQSRNAMRSFVEQRAREPRERILMTFTYLEEVIGDKHFNGCIFANAAGEFKEVGDPVFQAALTHKKLTRAYFEELAYAAQLSDPRRIAAEVNLLHEGAVAVAQMTRSTSSVRHARAMAQQLLSLERVLNS